MVQVSDLLFDGGQQAGWSSRSEATSGQSLAAFSVSQLDVEGRLCSFQNPPGVEVDMATLSAEQGNYLLPGDQIDLKNLLTVSSSQDHCRERGGGG